MCFDSLDPDGEVRGCYVGCTIGVSDISASRVLQPRNVPSGVYRTKTMHFHALVLFEVRRNFVFFFRSDKHDRRYVSVHVVCGFTLGDTNKPGPPLAARNSNNMHGASPYGGSLLSSKLPHAAE